MVDVISKRCIFESCEKRPSYNYKDQNKGLYCNDHKLVDMINIISKRCIFESCEKRPSYNYKD
jgi:hypothetical protein